MRSLVVVLLLVSRGDAKPCADDMVPIPAATFHMDPQHAVSIGAMCVDRTEVTVKAYAACVAAKRCSAPQIDVSPYCNRDNRPEHPINCVDWTQATSFCAWADKRLPTEAEWEFAARGTDGRLYPWGNEPPTEKLVNACGAECVAFGRRELHRDWVAMYDGDDGWPTTAPVGSYPRGASPFGALDMAGNVWEWTADPHGSARINRGGGWHAHLADDVRAALRSFDPPTLASNSIGFRCVRASATP